MNFFSSSITKREWLFFLNKSKVEKENYRGKEAGKIARAVKLLRRRPG